MAMMGKNHLVAGTAVAGTAVLVLATAKQRQHPITQWLDSAVATMPWTGERVVSDVGSWLWEWLVPYHGGAGIGYAVAAIVLLWLGSLLPDVDSPNSILGRHVAKFAKIGPHHGWTHTDWVLWGLFAASLLGPTRVLVWLWLGAWLHDELDGLSRAGRVRFYPLGDHRVVLLGEERTRCVVRGGRRRGVYLVGKRSEYVLLGGIVTGCVALSSAVFVLG